MKDDRRRYVLVGAFVVAMVAALVAWLATLGGSGFASHRYEVVYDNVLGLAEGTQVLYEGFPVGRITSIKPIERDGVRKFRVRVAVRRSFRLPEDSVAAIAAPGLLSAVVIDIDGGRSQTLLEPGSELRGAEAPNVFAIVSDVANELSALSEQSVKPLLQKLSDGTPEIVANLESFTRDLNATLARVDELLSPGNVARVDSILVNLERTTGGFAQVAGDLNRTRAELDALIGTVGQMLDREEGDVGQAIGDLQHSLASVARRIDAISGNLETTTRDLSEFSRQLRENPGVLVRGTEPAPEAAAP